MVTNDEINQWLSDLAKVKEANRELGAAYLRLRSMIPGAFDTPHAPSPKEVWQVTENALKNLLARVEIKEQCDGQTTT